MKKFSSVCVGLIVMLVFTSPALAAVQPVQVPMKLTYPFIRAMFVNQLFTLPGERVIVVNEESGECAHIELWKPEIQPAAPYIKLGCSIIVRAGLPVLDNCVGFGEWEGYIEVTQRLYVDKASGKLRFETVDSALFNESLQPVTVASSLWNAVKQHVHPYLSKVIVNTAFPMDEMRVMMPLFFAPEDRPQIDAWLKTLKLGQPRVESEAVTIDLHMNVETNPPGEQMPAVELSSEEIQEIVRIWETWDSFLILGVQRLIGEPLTDDERRKLLEVILDTRHGFVRALSENTLERDLVREQFVYTWQQLAEILKTHLINHASSDTLLRYITFFTASDALVALDKLGPTLGIDISRDGLVRLANLLADGGTVSLEYSPGVDPALRNLLDLGPPLDESGPAFNVPELDLFPEEENVVPEIQPQSLLRFLFPVVLAAEMTPYEDIRQWIPSGDTIDEYMNRVKRVLDQAAEESLRRNQFDSASAQMYRLLVPATAWQESCWRQFIRTGGKVKYLLSYNQTSVGIMQINERVWRGLYRQESLRWNVLYNARAGAEILRYYLRDHALKKMDRAHPLDMDTLCRAVYAMYNGGPGEFSRFLKRSTTNSFYKSDKLFWDKYILVRQGQLHRVSACFVAQ
ncbi:MAG TPA: lytic transglycosylase domain-containing protein [Thermodesulfobacteriota bacterium]|nr:lytic transglycosylase domain-containing protein [Thermodesulfobacteriota bacterium]HNU71696.1 lytic transglycosylase domain-containing protein [Thermodesulfobacteriota bacterium]HQO77278.1 lytic transglycosylase domain-containing protein [Thermodesulfobacteriota bacterium]